MSLRYLRNKLLSRAKASKAKLCSKRRSSSTGQPPDIVEKWRNHSPMNAEQCQLVIFAIVIQNIFIFYRFCQSWYRTCGKIRGMNNQNSWSVSLVNAGHGAPTGIKLTPQTPGQQLLCLPSHGISRIFMSMLDLECSMNCLRI